MITQYAGRRASSGLFGTRVPGGTLTITSDLHIQATENRMTVWYREAVPGFEAAVREWLSVWGWTFHEQSDVLSSCIFKPSVSGGGCQVGFTRPTPRGHWFPTPRDMRRLRLVMANDLKVETARLLDGSMAGCCCSVPASKDRIFVGRTGADGSAEALADDDLDIRRRQLDIANGAWAAYERVSDLGADSLGRYGYRCTRSIPERLDASPIAVSATLDAFLTRIKTPGVERTHKVDATRWKELEQLLRKAGFPSPPEEISLPAPLGTPYQKPSNGGDRKDYPTA